MAAPLTLSEILVAGLALSAVLIGLALIANEWLAERREDRERAAAFARRRALRADAHAWSASDPVAIEGATWSACDTGSADAGDGSCGGGE